MLMGKKSIPERDLTVYKQKHRSIIEHLPNDKISYLESMTKDTSFKKGSHVVLLNLERACHSCVGWFGNFLQDNAKELLKENTSVILISSSPDVYNSFLEAYGLADLNRKLVHKDLNGKYKEVFEEWYNIKLLKLSEGEIEDEKIYMPFELNDLANALLP